jgi:hypothetical protein
MFSGWIQEIIGYQHFFVWVLLSTIPAFIIAAFVKIDPEFGKKKEADPESVVPTEDQSVIEPPDGATPDARPDEPRDRY